jgi:hypothetical protein
MRYVKNKAFASCAAALFLVTLSCATAGTKVYSTFTVNGMVYDHSGSAVNGMEIRLGTDRSVKTDYAGRFSFPDTSVGDYLLKASMNGYESFTSQVRISSPADIVYISVFSLSDLLRAAKDSMRKSEWAEASSYAERALAMEGSNPRALYLKALILSSRLNPARNLDAAEKILTGMVTAGYDDPSVKRLISDIASESKPALSSK